MDFKTPAAGAPTSRAALSVSRLTIGSSTPTLSPTFFSHSPISASETDSPDAGTRTSISSPPPLATGAGAVFSAAPLDAGFGTAAPPSFTDPSSAPTSTVSPSCAEIDASTPALGAGTSTETLSVSSSTNGSSATTASPSFFIHFAIVASVTDSPSAGTRISVAMLRPSFLIDWY